jgi:hypothetical protein
VREAERECDGEAEEAEGLRGEEPLVGGKGGGTESEEEAM